MIRIFGKLVRQTIRAAVMFAAVITVVGRGQRVQADPAPGELKVATFNLNHPRNHPDAVFERWGRDLASQLDVLLVTEAYERRRTTILATAAGMPYVELGQDDGYPDVAIVSRTPLYRVQRQFIDRPGRLGSNDARIISVITDIRGIQTQFIISHWAIRDGDIEIGADWDSPARQATADAMLSLIDPTVHVTIIGGDFNAHSDTSETKTIAGVAIDSFTAAGFLEGQGPCPSGWVGSPDAPHGKGRGSDRRSLSLGGTIELEVLGQTAASDPHVGAHAKHVGATAMHAAWNCTVRRYGGDRRA